jgi:general secretion pathway protein G
METFKSSLHEFEMNAGRLPTEQEGLQALVQRPAGLDEAAWPGRYLDKPAVPADAFGSPYRYEVPGADGYEFELTSAGPDRAFGTEADVRLSDSWRKAQSR